MSMNGGTDAWVLFVPADAQAGCGMAFGWLEPLQGSWLAQTLLRAPS